MGGRPRAGAEAVTVIRADRSPLNEKRWCCTLACGCIVWVTATKKPKNVSAHICTREDC